MSVKIVQGECIEVMRGMADGSVNCCVTSPPYWGLRDYGTAKWEGGDAGCDHVEMGIGMLSKNTLGPNGFLPESNSANVGRVRQFAQVCGKCGARRIDGQIGLEESPDAYVAKMVAVFAEVKRLLRDDGTLWLNLGDSYASGKGTCYNPGGGANSLEGHANLKEAGAYKLDRGNKSDLEAVGLKPKDLVGIPWRVAFALQADGWYLRSDIIWHKPNPMPESVTDRCTKSHEYIFMLAKSERYYFDAGAINEPAVYSTEERVARACEDHKSMPSEKQNGIRPNVGKKRKPAGWDTGPGSHGTIHRDGRSKEVEYTEGICERRNKRDVWTVPSAPFRQAHFATFPPNLIRPCILAGTPQGGTALDPFGGSGTVGIVAEEEGRNSILIELNPDYVKMATRRTAQRGLFATAS